MGSSGTEASRTTTSRSRSSSPLAAAAASPSLPVVAPTLSPSQVMVKYLPGAEVHMVSLVMGTWTTSLIRSLLSSLKTIQLPLCLLDGTILDLLQFIFADSGQLFMCGDGSFGQLGAGDNHSRNLPFEVTYFNSRHVGKLAFGMRHSLVLLKDNSLYGFGSARRGQIGRCVSRSQKSYNIPRLIDGFPNCKLVNIYANGDHSAALNESGQLYIWGRVLIGEHDDDQPRMVLPSFNVSQVALGWHHALVLSGMCAMRFLIELYFLDMLPVLLPFCVTEGQVFTIGVYRHQKCDLPEPGNAVAQQSKTSATSSTHDETSSLSALEKVPCIDGEHVVQIASGTEHSAFVTDKGTVFTWGWGEHGQLGLGDTSDQVVPQRVNLGDKGPLTSGSLRVYCGSGFSIAVKSA